VLRTVNDQPTLWDSILPAELLVLSVELARGSRPSSPPDTPVSGTATQRLFQVEVASSCPITLCSPVS
jgi:hypothetical protein